MSDPVRWQDDAPGAPLRAAKLLSAAAPLRPMSDAERTGLVRVAARVAAHGSMAAGASAAIWKGAALGATVGASLLAIAVVAASLARSVAPASLPSTRVPTRVVDTSGQSSHPANRPEHSAITVLAPSVPTPSRSQSAPPSLQPEPTRAQSPWTRSEHTRASTALHAVPSAVAPTDSLRDESDLLTRALSELDLDPRVALATLATHVSRFPRGQLAPERECIWIDALDRLGRADAATTRARNVIAHFPDSPCARRVRHRTSIESTQDQETTP